jgi:hypothetical protein
MATSTVSEAKIPGWHWMALDGTGEIPDEEADATPGITLLNIIFFYYWPFKA